MKIYENTWKAKINMNFIKLRKYQKFMKNCVNLRKYFRNVFRSIKRTSTQFYHKFSDSHIE